MAAQPKLTTGREKRLLAILALGEPLEAACRAVNVSSTAVRNRANRDRAFAERLGAARQRRPVWATDWQVIAEQLEREHPERWSLPLGYVGDN